MDKKRKYFQDNFTYDYSLMDLADAILQTEDGHSFKVHKIVLAKQHKYFSGLFFNKPRHESSFLIPGLKGSTLSSILSYIYTGKIYVTDQNIAELIVASDYLMMDDLLSEVNIIIKRNLSVDNCFRIFAAAQLINRKDFLKEWYRFVQTHFEIVVYNSNNVCEFGELPLETFKLFLGDRNLCVNNEKTVFLAIRKWVNADIPNRLSLVPELIMYLAIPDVDETLATAILKDDIIAKNPFCEDLINKPNSNSVECLRSFVEKHSKSFVQLQEKRLPSKLNFIIRHSAIDAVDGIHVYITYDENIDLWRKAFEIHTKHEAIACANGCIYILKTVDNRNKRYDISEKRWYELDDFMIPRYDYAVIHLEGSIYVLGGTSIFTGEEIYDVEIYDPLYDVWFSTQSMFPITSFAAVAYTNYIYVVGYKITHGVYEMIAQVYDASSETWSMLPAVSINRLYFALATYGQKIYVIGGMDSNGYLKDVEVFDPVKNEWKIEASLPHTYYYPKAIVLDDLLFVYDNHLEDREYRKTNPPVYWNTNKACWEKLEDSSKLNYLHLYEFLTLENLDYISIISKENRHENFEKSPFN